VAKNIIIRKGEKKDLKQVYDLVIELAVFENAGNEVKNSVEEMEKDGFGSNPIFGFYVAENSDAVIGVSIYYYRYSTWKGKILYIEDLIVSEKYRRSGVGTRLMEASIDEAKSQDCNGVQWAVLAWNEPAIKFYEKYNPVFDGEWVFCRLDNDQLNNYNSTS
jgi:ribosomal protein S18 acetylase RimI-like enzyme